MPVVVVTFRHPDDVEPPVPDEIEAIAREVVDAIYVIHREMGLGLLEEPYTIFLADEIASRGLPVRVRPALPVVRRGRIVKEAYHPDIVVDGILIVEVKAVQRLSAAHHAQIMTYLKLAGLPLGYLVNFNELTIKEGTHRKLNPDRDVRARTCELYVAARASGGGPSSGSLA